MEWFCNTESHQSFADIKDFLDHMHTIHSEPLDETQLLNLHRGFQRPSNAHSGTCTLCGQHASRLKSHLALHLEQLALFAIPQTDYMATLEENDTSSNAARQGVPALSSEGSTRVASDPSNHESISEASVSRTGSFSRRMRLLRAAENDQYTQQDKTPALGSSEGIQEEVDTSWDQITPKFKDARSAMYSEQEADSSKSELMTPNVAIGEEPMSERDSKAVGWDRSGAIDLGRPSDRPWARRDTNPVGAPGPSDYTSYLSTPQTSDPEAMFKEPTIPSPKPPSMRKPPMSLAERTGRITAKLFSPFRRESHTYPEIPGEPLRKRELDRGRSHYSRASFESQFAENTSPDRPSNPNQPFGSHDHVPLSGAPMYPDAFSRPNSAASTAGSARDRNLALSIARTNSGASVTPTDLPLYYAPSIRSTGAQTSIQSDQSNQRPRMNPDSRPTEVVNTKERRSWRQRLSKAIGSRNKPSPANPAVPQLPYNPTVSDFESRSALGEENPAPSVWGSSEGSENPSNDNPAIGSSWRETLGLDANRQLVAGHSGLLFCHECHKEWHRDENGLTCPNCGSDFTELVEQAGADALD